MFTLWIQNIPYKDLHYSDVTFNEIILLEAESESQVIHTDGRR